VLFFVAMEQRAHPKLCFKLWKISTVTHKMLETVYKNEAVYHTLWMIQGVGDHQLLEIQRLWQISRTGSQKLSCDPEIGRGSSAL
jgi:hypothetical protein